jgi:hypothetical protein
MTTVEQVSSKEIFALLEKEGFTQDKVSIADEYYAVPTEEAIKAFGKRFGAFLWDAHLDTWVEEIWDCDDFAITAKALAAIDNAHWRKKTGVDCGIGFGIAWVMTEQGGHAINFALARNANKELEIHYYEPQVQPSNKIGEPFVWLQKKSRDYFVSPLWCYL